MRGLFYSESQSAERVAAVRLIRQNNQARELIHTETMAEVFEKALDALIAEKEKALGKTTQDKQPTPPAKVESALAPKSQNPRYIPAKFKRIIYARSKGQCEYASHQNIRCDSRRNLEIDLKSNQHSLFSSKPY